MFRRKAYNDLLKWKQGEQGRTALLIEGARRVGKTTLAKEFGAREYRSTVYIDFSKASDAVRGYFTQYSDDLDTLFRYLSVATRQRLYERETLFVFDEVQRYPRAREMIKHLVADGRFDYLETGSLVSIRDNVRDIVIPSEEDVLALEPLDFEEFLWARDQDMLAELILDSYDRRAPLDSAMHQTAMRLWREYLLVGGMPSVVSAFVSSNDLFASEREKRRILSLYRNDIARFGGGQRQRIERIFDEIPGQLSKHEKGFTLNRVESGARAEGMADAMFWLSDARVVNPCTNVSDPSVDLRMTRSLYPGKLYMADTGLLFTHAFGNGPAADEAKLQVMDGRISINEGMLAENAVAQALMARGDELVFHSHYDRTDASRRMEIDFLVVRSYANAAGKARVTPLEVKSGTHFSTRSLDKFKALYGKRVGVQVVLSPKELRVEGDRLYLPLYMAHLV